MMEPIKTPRGGQEAGTGDGRCPRAAVVGAIRRGGQLDVEWHTGSCLRISGESGEETRRGRRSLGEDWKQSSGEGRSGP